MPEGSGEVLELLNDDLALVLKGNLGVTEAA